MVLWSKTVSANAPTINLTAPNGGTFNAGTPINVTWTANDLDSDPLQFALDYSADNGATWLKINPKIIGNSLPVDAGLCHGDYDRQGARARQRWFQHGVCHVQLRSC